MHGLSFVPSWLSEGHQRCAVSHPPAGVPLRENSIGVDVFLSLNHFCASFLKPASEETGVQALRGKKMSVATLEGLRSPNSTPSCVFLYMACLFEWSHAVSLLACSRLCPHLQPHMRSTKSVQYAIQIMKLNKKQAHGGGMAIGRAYRRCAASQEKS